LLSAGKLSVQSLDSNFTLSLDPDALLGPTSIELKEWLDLPLPYDRQFASPIYQFDIPDATTIDLSIPLKLKISYNDSGSSAAKTVNFYDKQSGTWKVLPSYHHVEDHYVEAITHLPFAPIAILEHNGSEDGIASWYAWKNCLCAASRDFAKGSKVRVTRLKSGAEVVVTINDYGPEEWTGRLIDLDKVAFERLGNPRAGLIYVNVQPND